MSKWGKQERKLRRAADRAAEYRGHRQRSETQAFIAAVAIGFCALIILGAAAYTVLYTALGYFR